MSETEWMNAAQERGLISDNCVTIEDVAQIDYEIAVKILGVPELEKQP